MFELFSKKLNEMRITLSKRKSPNVSLFFSTTTMLMQHGYPWYFIHKIKIDIWKFCDRDDRVGARWINKLEIHFEIYKIDDKEDKISIVLMQVERLACHWFLSLTTNFHIKTEREYQEKLELLYIKDIKKVQQKSNFIEWEHMSYQQPPYPQFEKSSSIYFPPRKRIFPLDTKKDRILCFKCNATNWCLGHKFKEKKLYICKKLMVIMKMKIR